MNDRKYEGHPAYGMMRASRISGNRDLFMVDYPQQHFIRIEIAQAKYCRDLSNDYVYSDRVIVSVDMSEVQWARMIAAMNTQGVACTLGRYRDPASGENVDAIMRGQPMPKKELFKNEVRAKAETVAKALDESIATVQKMLAESAPKKGDPRGILTALTRSRTEISSNLPFVLQEAEEAIETAVESAKGEIDAYTDFAVLKLGERALAAVADPGALLTLKKEGEK